LYICGGTLQGTGGVYPQVPESQTFPALRTVYSRFPFPAVLRPETVNPAPGYPVPFDIFQKNAGLVPVAQ
jgi:hypothetical protein